GGAANWRANRQQVGMQLSHLKPNQPDRVTGRVRLRSYNRDYTGFRSPLVESRRAFHEPVRPIAPARGLLLGIIFSALIWALILAFLLF
ncbi:MAG: hypothetical protein ABW203_07015, partial [Novosphingobium sp.]